MDKTMNSWYYREMGSRNKKTGKLNYYQVKVTDYKIDDCECMQDNLDHTHLVNT